MLRKFPAWIVAILLIISAAGSSANAQRRHEWTLLGERHIDGRFDHDKIDVGRDNGKFRAIQLQVEDGDVMFERLQVRYLNGETEDISIRSEIPSGSRSRPIDLPGNRRTIESVSMWYGKRNWHSRPTIRVYGIR